MVAARRIAILISDLEGGGAQRQALFLAGEWARRGHAVTILTYEPPGTAAFFDVPPNVLIRRVDGIRKSTGMVARVVRNLERVRTVRAALRELKSDILFTFMAEISVTGLLAARPLKIPVVACERTNPRVYPTGLWRVMRDLAYPRCDRIVCQTRAAADYFASTGKARVIPNIVYVPDVSADVDMSLPARPFIASLGRLSTEKGHDVLIEAFARIAPLYPDIDLLIIGEGPRRAALEHLAVALNVAGRVHMPGASKDPFAQLSKAKAFILPSRFEGFPNALTEAMALGLPCVATGFGGVEDIIRDGQNGVIVPLEDADAMAQAIAGLLQYPDRAASIGDAARGVIDEFSPARVMALWDDALIF